MPKRKKVICLKCGDKMNFHAEKPDYAATQTNPELVDPYFGAVIEETHTCPGCGNIELILPPSR
jgi:ribosomal protein S27AE